VLPVNIQNLSIVSPSHLTAAGCFLNCTVSDSTTSEVYERKKRSTCVYEDCDHLDQIKKGHGIGNVKDTYDDTHLDPADHEADQDDNMESLLDSDEGYSDTEDDPDAEPFMDEYEVEGFAEYYLSSRCFFCTLRLPIYIRTTSLFWPFISLNVFLCLSSLRKNFARFE
jgi:hypothetical protein